MNAYEELENQGKCLSIKNVEGKKYQCSHEIYHSGQCRDYKEVA